MRTKRNWFSNFIPFDKPLIHRGIEYKTVEHYYQAMKTTNMSNRQRIADCDTPGKAKEAGRGVVLRKNWDTKKIKFMEKALRYKFRKGTHWHEKLVFSKGDLIEWNYWHDNYWGRCFCPKCFNKPSKNMLGVILMKLRKEFGGEY